MLSNKAFTLIEILIVVSIFIVVGAFSWPFYVGWQAATDTDSSLSEIVSTIRLAKMRSEAALADKAHGVYFDTSSSNHDIILYRGDDYVSRDGEFDLIKSFSASMEIDWMNISQDINFSQGPGEPSATGTLMVLNSETDQSYSVTLNRFGSLNVSEN